MPGFFYATALARQKLPSTRQFLPAVNAFFIYPAIF